MCSKAKAQFSSIIWYLEMMIRNWNVVRERERDRKKESEIQTELIDSCTLCTFTHQKYPWISCVYHFQFSLRQLITAKLTRDSARSRRLVSASARSLRTVLSVLYFCSRADYLRDDEGEKRPRDFFSRQLFRENGFRDVASPRKIRSSDRRRSSPQIRYVRF